MEEDNVIPFNENENRNESVDNQQKSGIGFLGALKFILVAIMFFVFELIVASIFCAIATVFIKYGVFLAFGKAIPFLGIWLITIGAYVIGNLLGNSSSTNNLMNTILG